jgi:hypothetical protein
LGGNADRLHAGNLQQHLRLLSFRRKRDRLRERIRVTPRGWL